MMIRCHYVTYMNSKAATCLNTISWCFFSILTLIILSMHEHRVLMTYLSLSMIDVTVNVHVTNKTQIINHDQMIYIHNIMNNTQNS